MDIQEINEYLNTIKLDKSQHTLVSYTTAIEKFIDNFGINNFEDIKTIVPSQCREHQSRLRETLSASSVNAKVRPLKAMYNWFLTNEYIESNPWAKVKELKVPKKLVAFLSEDEIYAILRSCSRLEDKLILSLLITTGLRRNELSSLKLSDYNGTHIIVNGKGAKQRKLALMPDVCGLMNEYIIKRNKKHGDSIPYLFVSKNRSRFSGDAIRMKVKSAMVRAGFSEERIKEIHTHSLRHTFVANLFESGADIYAAKAALGHQNLSTTQIYAHLRNSALDNALLRQKSFLGKDE